MQLKQTSWMVILIVSMSFSNKLNAQVTIGSGQKPAKAALIELKQEAPNNPTSPNDLKNITSKKGGLILPRVELMNLLSLEPFASPSDSDYADLKQLSVGLMVYNLYDNANSYLEPGIYYWDGITWNIILYTIY